MYTCIIPCATYIKNCNKLLQFNEIKRIAKIEIRNYNKAWDEEVVSIDSYVLCFFYAKS